MYTLCRSQFLPCALIMAALTAGIFMLFYCLRKKPMWVTACVLLLIVGCFLEATAAMLILCPILFPTVVAFGIDPVHFGIIVVLNLCIGLITPPLGVNLYVSAGLKNERIETVINKHLFILMFICLANLLLITYIPDICLMLPNMMAA